MKITPLQNSITGKRFRIVAEPENKQWKAREGIEPWCEITVTEEEYGDNTPTGKLIVTSFGGEVWPSAWPSMFSCHPNAMSPNGSVLTEKARKLLGYPPEKNMNEEYNALGLALEIRSLQQQDKDIERLRKELDEAYRVRNQTLTRLYHIAERTIKCDPMK